MAQDPAGIDDLAEPFVALYQRAEMYLIEVIRRALIKTGESPTWAEAQLLAIRQERGNIEGMASVLHKRLPTMWRDAVEIAWTRGQLDAEKEVISIPQNMVPNPQAITTLNTQTVFALTAEAMDIMTPVHQNILRATDDVWRKIAAEAAGYTVTGVMTPQQAAQRAFTRICREGIPFFTDKAGRRWGLDTYAEMAVRTVTNNALIAGHTQTLQEHGIDLVVVSSHKNPAPQCAPYERKILSLGRYPAGTRAIGDNIVNITATLSEAKANGFRHPNCRHQYSAYVPGFTKTDTVKYTGDDSGYKATQKQRYYERQIRASKRMEAAAIDERDVRAARQRKNAYQAKLRAHVAKHDLPRRRHREQMRQPASGAVGLSFDD